MVKKGISIKESHIIITCLRRCFFQMERKSWPLAYLSKHYITFFYFRHINSCSNSWAPLRSHEEYIIILVHKFALDNLWWSWSVWFLIYDCNSRYYVCTVYRMFSIGYHTLISLMSAFWQDSGIRIWKRNKGNTRSFRYNEYWLC